MFQFKQFKVAQDQCAMKVGTDGVLLGAWAEANSPNTILDIGTGTGLIALMLAQRFPKAAIKALEIDASAAKQAKENFKQSPWNDRLNAIHTPLQTFNSGKQFDLIVSNPPYFENVSKAKSTERTQARHTDALSFETLIDQGANLLSKKGTIALILPSKEKENVVRIALEKELHLHRICWVKGSKNTPIKRVLMQFSFQEKVLEENTLVIEKLRHQYTEEYILLCQDFYLKM